MRFETVAGTVDLRPSERRLYLHGHPLTLGPRAFDLLLALVERRDRVVGKDELLALVWPGQVVEEGNLPVQVSALRKVLGDRAISTVPGRGYRFTAPLTGPPAGDARLGEAAVNAETVRPDDGPSARLEGWLPAAATALLGRAEALAGLRHRLASTRCLTLAGAGGSGKTRLAMALAVAVRAHYPGGAWWVGLETLSDPALLAQAVAGAIGDADPLVAPMKALTQRLSGRRTLLVLDNCEHLVEACADLHHQACFRGPSSP